MNSAAKEKVGGSASGRQCLKGETKTLEMNKCGMWKTGKDGGKREKDAHRLPKRKEVYRASSSKKDDKRQESSAGGGKNEKKQRVSEKQLSRSWVRREKEKHDRDFPC